MADYDFSTDGTDYDSELADAIAQHRLRRQRLAEQLAGSPNGGIGGIISDLAVGLGAAMQNKDGAQAVRQNMATRDQALQSRIKALDDGTELKALAGLSQMRQKERMAKQNQDFQLAMLPIKAKLDLGKVLTVEQVKHEYAQNLKRMGYDADAAKLATENQFKASESQKTRDFQGDQKQKELANRVELLEKQLASRASIADADRTSKEKIAAEGNKSKEGIADKGNASREKIASGQNQTKKDIVKDRKNGPKTLPSKQVEGLGEAVAIPKMISDLREVIKANQKIFGPVQGRINSMNPWDATAQAVNAQIYNAKQTIGKLKEGGVLRKEDEAKYEKMLPSLGDTPATALDKLDVLERDLTAKYNSAYDALGKSGYDVSGLPQRFTVPGLPKNAIGGGVSSDLQNAAVQELARRKAQKKSQ